MSMLFAYLFGALWVGWLGYWMISSAGVKAAVRTTGWAQRLAYSAPLWVTAVLLINRDIFPSLDQRFIAASVGVAVAGLVVTAIGLGFAIWARIVLGANWSSDVTVKKDHELIVAGPYALTRHPIYTGLGLAFIGTALAIGEWRGVIAVLLAWGSFWYKLSIEERFMAETFGARYAAYRERVKAIIPFLL